jgi:hypothetical protein
MDLLEHLAAFNKRIASARGDEFLIGDGEPVVQDAIAAIRSLRDENERLREALTAISAAGSGATDALAVNVCSIARFALNKEGG